MATTLRIEHLVKRFEGLVAVNDLSIDVQERKIHALIGPNGSGKTTTLNLINSVIPPTSGQIWFRDTLLTGKPTFETVKAGVGRTFQNIKLFSSMTVLENVMMGGQKDVSHNMLRFIVDLRGSHREERVLREKACEVLDSIGMYHLRNETVDNLAYGRQKVCELGRALMTTPQLILLDEPAAGLDPEGRDEILSEVKEYHKKTGTTVLLVSHSMEDIAKYANRVLVMSNKKIAMYDTVENVFARASELLELGLSVPQVTKIFLKLREMGVDVPADVYTIPYAVKTILAAKARRDAGEPLVLPRDAENGKGGVSGC